MNSAASRTSAASGLIAGILSIPLSLLLAGVCGSATAADCLPVFTDHITVPDQPIFTTSKGQFAVVAHDADPPGGNPISNYQVTVVGPNPSDFPIVEDQITGSTLQPGQTAQLLFRFAPTGVGVRTVTFIVTSTACNSPHTWIVTGRGTGSAVQIVPGLLDFGDQAAGSASDPQSLSIINSGATPLTINGVSLTGTDASNFSITSDSGEGLLAPGAHRTVSLRFLPIGTGSRGASLTVASNAAGSPHSAGLSGAGIFGHIQQLASGSHPVAATSRLSLPGADIPSSASTVSAIRQVGADGSLSVLDPPGTALVQVPAAAGSLARIMLDTTRANLPDGVGLARLLRVEMGRSGFSGLLALRADNTRGIYRLDNDALTLLAVLPQARGSAELAVGGASQVTYVAPTADGSQALYQSTGAGSAAAGVELLHQGTSLVNGVTAGPFTDLTSNEAGGLAVLVHRVDGTPLAVLRRTASAFETVAAVGQTVLQGRGGTTTGILTELRRPRLGPEGSVVFQGGGAGFENFYVVRPTPSSGGILPPDPLLTGPAWSSDSASFDFELSADGTAAVRASPSGSSDPRLFLVPLTGPATVVVAGRRDALPIGRPVFGPGDLLFFLGQSLTLPLDRDGRAPVGLFRFRPGDTAPVGVALPGQPVPEQAGARLLSVPQLPSVSNNGVSFTALIGGPESLPVPGPALFQVPLGGTFADSARVSAAGAAVPDSGRLAIPRDLSYRGDGTLVFGGLLPGGGPVIAPASPAATTAAAARTQAAATDMIVPMVATGDTLGTGQVESTLPPLLSLGADRELFVARLVQPNGLNNEGLFTANRSKRVEQVAATPQAVQAVPGAIFDGLADTRIYVLSPPSVAADGSVVFKALLDRGTGSSFGIFQWASGAVPVAVALSDTPLVAGDKLPYSLDHWAAGPGGLVYFQARTAAGKVRLFASSSARGLQVVAESGVTPLAGGGVLIALLGFVLTGTDGLFLNAFTTAGPGIFHLVQGQLQPVARAGAPVPPLSDGRGTGLVFASSFQLLPASARGELLFRAYVQKPGDTQTRLGSFRLRQGQLESLSIQSVGVEGERSLAVDELSDTLEVENGNGFSVSAVYSSKDGWMIVRSQLDPQKKSVTSVVIAQEGRGAQRSLRRFAALDAGPLLDREGLPPRTGPVFTINEAGDVAFLASDGKSWGIYQVPAP